MNNTLLRALKQAYEKIDILQQDIEDRESIKQFENSYQEKLELEIEHKNARIEELEGLEVFHTNDAAITYQKELVKYVVLAEKRIKELENHNDESIHGFYNEDEMAEKIEQHLKPYINSEEPSE